jgi:hypothetical protein
VAWPALHPEEEVTVEVVVCVESVVAVTLISPITARYKQTHAALFTYVLHMLSITSGLEQPVSTALSL